MPTDSRTYSEKDVKDLIAQHIRDTELREVRSILITYDRPPYPTPTDPGGLA